MLRSIKSKKLIRYTKFSEFDIMKKNKTPKQILGSLGISLNPDAGISENYDEFILEWMADIYTYLQWKYNLKSEDIVTKIEPEDLYKKYSPLHEASLENSTEKLRKIYNI